MPVTVVVDVAPDSGTAPLTVYFAAFASGGTPPYSYLWQFGDGSEPVPEASAIHTYEAGDFEAVCVVTDSQGLQAVGGPVAIDVSATIPNAYYTQLVGQVCAAGAPAPLVPIPAPPDEQTIPAGQQYELLPAEAYYDRCLGEYVGTFVGPPAPPPPPPHIPRIYLVNGSDSKGSAPINRAYNPASNAWASAAAPPIPTHNSVLPAGAVSGRFFVVGGKAYAFGEWFAANHAFDASTDTWSSRASDITARYEAGTGVALSRVYVADGFNASGYLANNNVYDPGGNTWAGRRSDPFPRDKVVGAGVGSKVYIIDGSKSGFVSYNEEFSTAGNVWFSMARQGTPARVAVGGKAVGTKIYVVDGILEPHLSAVTGANQAYSATANTWANRASDPTPRQYPQAAVLSSLLYVIGGATASFAVANVNHAYDPFTNTWSVRAADVQGRYFGVAGAL